MLKIQNMNPNSEIGSILLYTSLFKVYDKLQ